VAEQHLDSRLSGAARQFDEQASLSDSCVAPEQHMAADIRLGLLAEQACQFRYPLYLVGATDERYETSLVSHINIIAARCSVTIAHGRPLQEDLTVALHNPRHITSPVVTSRKSGPQRSESVESLLRSTRLLALFALLALAAGIMSDFFDSSTWIQHPLLAGLVTSLIVVMLSGAIVNEAIERRRRRRWSVLAQYVMLELVRHARMIWTAVLDLTGLVYPGQPPAELADSGAAIVRDRSRLSPAIAGLVADSSKRQLLHDGIAGFARHGDELLGRWAPVMLNADVYAEIIDRHVELATNLAWLGSLLDVAEPPDDEKRHRRARAHAAAQIEGTISGDALVERLVVITQLAEELDRTTLPIALRLVPMEWWVARLGTSVAPESRGRSTTG
jgi:hypothetical protein